VLKDSFTLNYHFILKGLREEARTGRRGGERRGWRGWEGPRNAASGFLTCHTCTGKLLCFLANNWAIPGSHWLISVMAGGRENHGMDRLCPSSMGRDSAPTTFPGENRDEAANPGSVCWGLEESLLQSL
jgi:hypothetical protein